MAGISTEAGREQSPKSARVLMFFSLRHCVRILHSFHGDDANAMGQRACPRPILSAMLIATAFVWLTPSAKAANAVYCVTCKNPDQTYRCKVAGVGSRPHDALKLYCVIRTAKEGHHASCKATAATAACQGVVKVYDYNGPSLPEGLADDPRIQKFKKRAAEDKRAFEKPTGDEPKTLFELGGRAMDASRKGLRNAGSAIGVSSSADEAPATANAELPPTAKTAPLPVEQPAETSMAEPVESVGTATRMKHAAQNAGSAVGGFARKSYNCVLSLFSNCSEEAEN